MEKLFVALSSEKIANLVKSAVKRVVMVAPSIHDTVGDALCEASARLDNSVEIVSDINEKVLRLGYGSVDALIQLRKRGIKIRNHSGLRIGLLVCDNQAWIFSPVALFIETEPLCDDLPNALAISAEEATNILLRISNTVRNEVVKSGADPDLAELVRNTHVELSQFSDNSDKLDAICKNLEEVPPVSFDISRQVQVFQPYIQYVELKLSGCSIQKHKIKLPKSIIGLASNNDVEGRLHATFDLIEKNSSLSSKHLESEVNELRKTYTRTLGKHGRVMLKAQRHNFDGELKKIEASIKVHQKQVEDKLVHELAYSMNELVDYYLPLVMAKPPRQLAAQLSAALTKERVIRWLIDEIGKCIPPAESLIDKMKLECVYKDLTYDTLQEDQLAVILKKEFPLVQWDKPFNEFRAAKENNRTQEAEV